MEEITGQNLIASQITPPLTTPTIPSINMFTTVTNMLMEYKYILIAIIIGCGILYYAYKNNYFSCLTKKTVTEEPVNEKQNVNDINILDIDKNYHILDENRNPININLKEMTQLHRHNLEKEKEIKQYQEYIKRIEISNQQLEEETGNLNRELNILREEQTQTKMKVSHPKKKIVLSEDSDDNLNDTEINQLQKELDDLQKDNNI